MTPKKPKTVPQRPEVERLREAVWFLMGYTSNSDVWKASLEVQETIYQVRKLKLSNPTILKGIRAKGRRI